MRCGVGLPHFPIRCLPGCRSLTAEVPLTIRADVAAGGCDRSRPEPQNARLTVQAKQPPLRWSDRPEAEAVLCFGGPSAGDAY
jgi:hypothetical protein